MKCHVYGSGVAKVTCAAATWSHDVSCIVTADSIVKLGSSYLSLFPSFFHSFLLTQCLVTPSVPSLRIQSLVLRPICKPPYSTIFSYPDRHIRYYATSTDPSLKPLAPCPRFLPYLGAVRQTMGQCGKYIRVRGTYRLASNLQAPTYSTSSPMLLPLLAQRSPTTLPLRRMYMLNHVEHPQMGSGSLHSRSDISHRVWDTYILSTS